MLHFCFSIGISITTANNNKSIDYWLILKNFYFIYFITIDLDISRGQLELFLDQYDETPWKVLNFLTSYINYGGRVTDYIDLRTMDVIMKSFYQPSTYMKS